MKRLNLPPDPEEIKALDAGDEVLLFGEALTMRDAALKRIERMIEAGEEIPFEIEGTLVYHAGPSPPSAGRPSGAIGPTTSARMDPFLPLLFEMGVVGTLGKGPRGRETAKLHKSSGAVYLVTVGGAGALLGERVVEMEQIAFEDLGPGAVYRVRFDRFPAVVAVDSEGRDFLAEQYRVHRRDRR